MVKIMILMALCRKYELKDERILLTTVTCICSCKDHVHDTKVSHAVILKINFKKCYFIIFHEGLYAVRILLMNFKIF